MQAYLSALRTLHEPSPSNTNENMKLLPLMTIPTLLTALSGCQKHDNLLLLVGSYNTAQNEAIGVFSFDQETGEYEFLQGVKGIDNPSFLCTNAVGDRVYAVTESDDPEQAALHALSLDQATGALTLLYSQTNHAGAPCNITMSPAEDYVVCANYTGGSMTIFPIAEDGKIEEPSIVEYDGSGPHPNQTQSHVHAINFTPDGRYLLANDLGMDCIHVYPVKAKSESDTFPLIDVERGYDLKVDAGAGPRHLCWSPDDRFAYVISELSGQIFTLTYDGVSLKVVNTIVADTLNGGGSADIHMTSDGAWLYASHRLKGDGISIFRVNPDDGSLKREGYQPTGIHPRNFLITPNDRYLLVACRDSNVISIYERDKATGQLKDTGRKISFQNPVFVNTLSLLHRRP